MFKTRKIPSPSRRLYEPEASVPSPSRRPLGKGEDFYVMPFISPLDKEERFPRAPFCKGGMGGFFIVENHLSG